MIVPLAENSSEEWKFWIYTKWHPNVRERYIGDWTPPEGMVLPSTIAIGIGNFVALTEAEYQEGIEGGTGRYNASTAMGLQEQEVTTSEGRGFHKGGALAERAFAKWLGVPWDPKILKLALVQQDDVAGIEVRSTTLPCPCGEEEGCLRMNKKGTKDTAIYVLLIRRGRVFEVVGWCYGKQGKKKKYWGAHYPRRAEGWSQNCYGIPRRDLDHDVETVKDMALKKI